jgi:hypothetical protein
MERRNFMKLFPVGLVALTTGTKPLSAQEQEEIVKAKQITIHGDDGEYAVLAVKKDSTAYRDVSPTTRMVINNSGNERARINSTGVLFTNRKS